MHVSDAIPLKQSRSQTLSSPHIFLPLGWELKCPLQAKIVSIGTNTVITITVPATAELSSNLVRKVLSMEHGNEVEDRFANTSVSASCEIRHRSDLDLVFLMARDKLYPTARVEFATHYKEHIHQTIRPVLEAVNDRISYRAPLSSATITSVILIFNRPPKNTKHPKRRSTGRQYMPKISWTEGQPK